NEADRAKDKGLERTKWENAFELHAPQYELKSDISREIIEFVGKHMQETFEFFVKEIPVSAPPVDRCAPLPVRVFREEDTFRKLTGQPNATGVYTFRDIVIFQKKPEDPWSRDLLLLTLDHESCHYYLHIALGENMPRWVDEGLSTYFAISRMTNAAYKKEYTEEQLVPVRDALEKKGRFYGIEEVFDFTQDGYGLGTGETEDEKRLDRRMHYGESVLLCGFLFSESLAEKSAYGSILKKVLKALADGKKGREAGASGFEGVDLAKFEADWKAYIRNVATEDVTAPKKAKPGKK
ncbi:MAG: hypothetical protein RDV41_08085, partial [Planctomycetota bacterium]|nr:hypothetical protein [Planctomycetota bacterium]